MPAWLQALPFAAVFLFFFVTPLLLVVAVSLWPTHEYELVPGFTFENYAAVFAGCTNLADPCVTLKTYASTLRFSLMAWAATLVLGFAIAYFLAFHVRTTAMQTLLFGVDPANRAVFAAAAALAVVMTLAGSLLPAWRALGIDPIAATRSE